MFKKKRGLNQIDWSISLAIFLLYVAWFFVIVKPQVIDTGVFAPNSEELKNSFFELTKTEINKIPVFVTGENSLSDQLLEIDASFLKDENYGFITNKPYLIEGDTIYVVDDLSTSTNIYYIAESNNITYTQYGYRDEGIDVGNDSVNPNSNITVFFTTEIDGIYFNDEEKIDNIKYYQNGNVLSNTNFSFTNRFLFGDFLNIFDTFSVSDKLIASSDHILSTIKKIDKINDINVSIEFTLLNYTSFYIDNLNYDSIDDIEDECVEQNGKQIKLIDDNGGVYFIFNKDVDITICNIDDITINFNFTNQNIKYAIGFNDNNLTNIPEIFSDYDVEFGISVNTNYPLLSKVRSLQYSGFTVEGINGFRLSVYNTTSIETDIRNNNILNRISSGSNTTQNIFSKDELISVQDDYGNIRRMTLNVLVW